ncbi:response regulator [Candidatus Saccharibacteria bacterium TM7i]|nr:response regulator [Candidatus Saccharibacteria bacterium TM7i]
MAKILLVEDDKSLREIYGVRLMAEGYEIVSAGDGEEALAMAIKERPNLIISDVMMPKISGFDMLDILRSTTETKDVKVIMMTALSSEDQRARGEALGADRYLVKSQVGIEDVVRTVHEVIGDSVAPAAVPQFGPGQVAPAATAVETNSIPAPMPAAPAPPVIPTPAPVSMEPMPAAPAPAVAPTPVAPVEAPLPVVAPVVEEPAVTMPELPPLPEAPVEMPAPIQPPAAAPTPVAPAPAEVAPAPVAAPTPQPMPAPQAPIAPQQEVAPIQTPAAPVAPEPVMATPVAQPTPQPVAPAPAAPVESNLPQPTAPFSSPAPASLGERVIEPLVNPTAPQQTQDIASQMAQALGGETQPPQPPQQ